MPYINLRTTKKLSSENCENVKSALGKAIECIPGKSEARLMIGIEDGVKLWFKGDSSADSAVIDVDLFGAVNSAACNELTGIICDILRDELNISPDRVYVKYSGYSDWGWNGANF